MRTYRLVLLRRKQRVRVSSAGGGEKRLLVSKQLLVLCGGFVQAACRAAVCRRAKPVRRVPTCCAAVAGMTVVAIPDKRIDVSLYAAADVLVSRIQDFHPGLLPSAPS